MGKPNCKVCGVSKTIDNTYAYKNRLSSYCKSCEKMITKGNKQYNRMGASNKKRTTTTKEWTKTNKNHYPDSEWVWQQIELNLKADKFIERLDQKYTLSTHGNKGKTNRWKNKNK